MNPSTNSNTSGSPLVAESDFSYVPPAEADPSEQADFSQSLKDIVSEIEGEFNPPPEFTDEELGSDSSSPDPAVEKAPEATEEPQDEPAVARGMERLVAREVALQAKEQAFQAREARAQALEQELTSLRSAMPSQDIKEKLNHSPSEAIKALGQDPETVVRLMIAEQLEAKGQEVPAALKEFVADAKRERRVKELEAKLEARTRAEQHAQEFNAVHLGAREYVKQFVGDSKETAAQAKALPTLADVAKIDQDFVHLEIMEEIKADARARAAADPNGQPIPYSEAAKRVEARWFKLKGFLTKGPAQNVPTKQAAGKPIVTPPQNKPPVAPLKPWQKKDDDIYANGIKEAEREFHRLEAQRRRS